MCRYSGCDGYCAFCLTCDACHCKCLQPFPPNIYSSSHLTSAALHLTSVALHLTSVALHLTSVALPTQHLQLFTPKICRSPIQHLHPFPPTNPTPPAFTPNSCSSSHCDLTSVALLELRTNKSPWILKSYLYKIDAHTHPGPSSLCPLCKTMQHLLNCKHVATVLLPQNCKDSVAVAELLA